MDSRQLKDLEEEMGVLAEGYVPEWKFTLDNPDVGSVIGIIFAKQMMENLRSYNKFLDRCHLEYMNMLGISLKAPQPARLMAVFRPVSDTEEVTVGKGTGLVVDTDSEELSRTVFELCSTISVTPAKIIDLVRTSKSRLLELRDDLENADGIKLGEFPDGNDKKKQLLLYHTSVFNVYNGKLSMHLEADVDFADELERGNYGVWYMTEDGACDAVVSGGRDGDFVLAMDKPLKRIPLDEDGENTCSLIGITQLHPSEAPVHIDSIGFSSTGTPRRPDYVCANRVEQDPSEFLVFGDELNIYNECYIGLDEYFNQAGAIAVLDFDFELRERVIGLRPQPEEDLKIIKRKKRQDTQELLSEAYAQGVTYEYYSEQGWKKLDIMEPDNARFMFGTDRQPARRLAFRCPGDWQKNNLDGYYGRMLRIRLVSSEDCYMQPCRHYLPLMKNLRIEYSYDGGMVAPVGYERLDLYEKTSGRWQEGRLLAFSPAVVDEDALYVGFDRGMAKGPVSIFFKFMENRGFKGMPVRFEYSTGSGFRQMSVIDNTNGGAISGTVVFNPPRDFAKKTVAGREAFYVRIVDVKRTLEHITGDRPVLEDIIINATEAENLQTLDEMEFYVETPVPDMKYDLGISGIYDARVRVMEEDKYVLWHEVDDFAGHEGERAYIIDRIHGTLLFGDGVNNPIPRVTAGVAFLVVPRVCRGELGNVPANSVDGGFNSLNAIASVRNPYPAYGGTDMETVARARKRGTHIMSCCDRLVTARDFEQEAYVFSDNIAKAKCTTDDEGHIILTLLMKDCELETNSFNVVKEGLKKHISQKCEMTVRPDDIIIREPLFAELSVHLWVSCTPGTDVFVLQQEINGCLDEYLRPITGNNGDGWNIGELPQRTQVIMKLDFAGDRAAIHNFDMNVRFVDSSGTHETDAERLRNNPYVVVKGGRHEIHVLRSRV
jgi:hypothetical protein